MNKYLENVKKTGLMMSVCQCDTPEVYALMAKELEVDLDFGDDDVRRKFMREDYAKYQEQWVKHYKGFLKPCGMFGDAELYLCADCLIELSGYLKVKDE